MIYERRWRLAEADGRPFEDSPPGPPRNGPRLSIGDAIAETLRRRREQLALCPATGGPEIASDKGEYR
jgi:hypothetical protein